MKPTQKNRQAKFKSSLGDDTLLLNQMFAREQISGLFEYQLTLVSEDENIDLYEILGEPALVELELPGGEYRYFAGHVAEFSFASFRDNLAEYRAVLRPWLWLLTRAGNHKIFQNKAVPDIIKQVCQNHGFTDIDDRLGGKYAERVFCVQYNETDFAFLCRLMEEEGIYYFFEHEKYKHTLVLADSPSAHDTFGKYDVVPWYPPDAHDHREREHLDDWSMTRGVRTGKFIQRDFDFTKPEANLEVVSRIAKPHAQAEFENYRYPGGYSEIQRGEAIARTRLEADQADHELLAGRGNARGMIPGFLFTLELFPRDDQNREYLILEVTHNLHQGGYDSGGVDAGDDFEYGCSLQAMPSSESYRPPRVTPRPVIHGPQTAIVMGKSGEEIWTNKHGQVKVQFHWDRVGKKDQNSSCWVRVSQAWAGKQWGVQFIPRIGQEVVVEFLEGDPDRPIITGSVYNGDNKPPYDLPANQTQSGIKTRSTKSGTRDNYNEIRFEDKKGSEQLYIHAERNMDTRVENCQTLNVDVDRTVNIGKDDKETVNGDRERKVDGKEDVTISKDWTQTVTEGNWNTTVSIGEWQHVSHGVGITAASKDISVSAMSGILNLTGVNSVAMNSFGEISIHTPQNMMITALAGITVSAPAGIKIVDSLLDGMSAIEKQIHSAKEEFVTTYKRAKSLSTSLVGVDMSYKAMSIAHNTVDMTFPAPFSLKKLAGSRIEKHGISVEDAKAAGIHRFKVYLMG